MKLMGGLGHRYQSAGVPRQPSSWTPFAALVAACLITVLGFTFPDNSITTSTLIAMAFMAVTTMLLSLYLVPIKFGSLRLVMIGTQVAAMLFSPGECELIGLIAGISRLRHGHTGGRYFGVAAPILWTAAGAFCRIIVTNFTHMPLLAAFSVSVVMTIINWALTGLEFRLVTGDRMSLVLRRNFDLSWISAFAYFGLCSWLIAGVLDGSVKGYFLASLAAYLSTTLTVSISERRKRQSLESHVRDRERYLAYVRATEGIIHRLRNECALAKGYIEEILVSRVGAQTKRRAQIARDALNASMTALVLLGSALTAGLSAAKELINADNVLKAAIDVVRPFAREKRVEIRDESRTPLWVFGDEHLLRDVFENLLLNGVEAAPQGGWVRISSASSRDHVEIRVSDNGPGIPEVMRDRLFEPHLTTKATGTGMGLFTSYGVIREHRGRLLYDGSEEGAVFVVQLPLAPAPAPSTVRRAGHTPADDGRGSLAPTQP